MRLYGWPLLRMFSISIVIHPSWFVLAAIVWWNIASGLFQSTDLNRLPTEMFFWSMIATFLFFLSLVFHEIAHALSAKRFGIPVRQISLFLLGGIAFLEDKPDNPLAEGLISAAGPIMSVLLAILFYVVSGIPFIPQSLIYIVEWLFQVNIILALFNLLPGYPLDGGRILTSGLWHLWRDREKAEFTSILTGKIIGNLFITSSLFMMAGISLPVLGHGLVNGLWLMLIGFFISSSAYETEQISEPLIDSLRSSSFAGSLYE